MADTDILNMYSKGAGNLCTPEGTADLFTMGVKFIPHKLTSRMFSKKNYMFVDGNLIYEECQSPIPVCMNINKKHSSIVGFYARNKDEYDCILKTLTSHISKGIVGNINGLKDKKIREGNRRVIYYVIALCFCLLGIFNGHSPRIITAICVTTALCVLFLRKELSREKVYIDELIKEWDIDYDKLSKTKRE